MCKNMVYKIIMYNTIIYTSAWENLLFLKYAVVEFSLLSYCLLYLLFVFSSALFPFSKSVGREYHDSNYIENYWSTGIPGILSIPCLLVCSFGFFLVSLLPLIRFGVYGGFRWGLLGGVCLDWVPPLAPAGVPAPSPTTPQTTQTTISLNQTQIALLVHPINKSVLLSTLYTLFAH